MSRRFAPLAALLVPLVVGSLVACEGRPRAPGGSPVEGDQPEPRTGPTIAVLDVSNGLPEQPGAGLLGVASQRQSFDELVREVGRTGNDRNVKGVLVRFGEASFGLARAAEVGEVLAGLGSRGLPVYCHADGYTNATFYAAARGCSKIYVSPVGEVEAVGLAAQIVYMRRLLADHLDLSIDFLQVGRFKGAEEPFTRDGPSDEARASLEGTLADIRESWLEGLRASRGGNVADVVEDGPYAAERSKELGLVDEVAYLDEVKAALKKDSGAVRDEVRFGPGSSDAVGGDFADLVRILAGEGVGTAPVALIRATGSIAMRGGGGPFGTTGITEREMSRALQRVEKDDDIKALVLRIDSPGGSALASDLLWHQLMRVRAKKPLVVSVGDMAASGGYYLACAGDVIFAEATSIVGSIGVVGGKIAAAKALENIGVHAETFPAKRGDPKAAARAAYMSPLVPWDDATRARLLEAMTSVYQTFLARIAEGRNMPITRVVESAEGRIFSGREAKERGLVDEIGGLSAAIARARELAGLDPDARVFVLGQRGGLLDALAGADDVEGEGARVLRASPFEGAFDLAGHLVPELVPFAASLSPLVEGERLLAAIPFGIVVR